MKKLFKLSPALKRELQEKGVFALFMEAFSLVGLLAVSYFTLVLIAELSKGA